MRVICVDLGVRTKHSTGQYVKIAGVYNVKNMFTEYSEYAGRMVSVYEFYEMNGYFEQGLFIPLSNIDEMELVNQRENNNK